ncbi:hypothetical protein YC2023_118961 [Brassica napus]
MDEKEGVLKEFSREYTPLVADAPSCLLHRRFIADSSKRERETRRDHRRYRRGGVEEIDRDQERSSSRSCRGGIKETERHERLKSSIDHGAAGEIERHEETSAPIDHSAIMVESTERSVSPREKMAESSRKKHTQLVFREREKETRSAERVTRVG